MSARFPKPATTAVIIAGASEWPFADQFEASPQFKNSATHFRDFILSTEGFDLPKDNLLWLFDTDQEQSVIVRDIAHFLSKRQTALTSKGGALSDVIFYYVGHGGFDTGAASAYFLALRRTNTIDALSSSLAVSSLRRALRESARDVRHYLILDCCFAAAALAPYLQLSAAAQAMVAQVRDAFPPAGTALLCASGAIVPAKAKRGATFTMFSEALLEILRTGVPNGPRTLSLSEVGIAVRGLLKSRYGDEAVRPEVHSPEQSEGSVADIPLFRNVDRGEGAPVRPPLPEGVLLNKSRSGGGNTASNVDGLFKEFDESDAPARIPPYVITDQEWSQLPQQVRSMLKQLEGLSDARPVGWYLGPLSLGVAIVMSSLLLLTETNVLQSTPLYVRQSLGFIGIGVFSLLLLWGVYQILLLTLGQRVRDRATLRPLSSATFTWEGFPVMSLLRQPRDIVRFRGRTFRRIRIQKNLNAAIIYSLLSIICFFGGVFLYMKLLWSNPLQ
jgi:hypothetical protein